MGFYAMNIKYFVGFFFLFRYLFCYVSFHFISFIYLNFLLLLLCVLFLPINVIDSVIAHESIFIEYEVMKSAKKKCTYHFILYFLDLYFYQRHNFSSFLLCMCARGPITFDINNVLE